MWKRSCIELAQMPNKEEMQKLMDDDVLQAIKEIEQSLKDGSLMMYTNSKNYQPGVLPTRQYIFQVSLLHQHKEEKK